MAEASKKATPIAKAAVTEESQLADTSQMQCQRQRTVYDQPTVRTGWYDLPRGDAVPALERGRTTLLYRPDTTRSSRLKTCSTTAWRGADLCLPVPRL